jgi:exportin-T
MLYQTLHSTIAKTKYTVVSAWSEDEGLSDDVESEDFRKGLQSLQQAVATVDEALYIRLLGEVVERAFKGFAPQEQRADWQDINLALHEMFLFGEVAAKSGGLYSKGQPTSPAARTLTAMVEQMVRSGM